MAIDTTEWKTVPKIAIQVIPEEGLPQYQYGYFRHPDGRPIRVGPRKQIGRVMLARLWRSLGFNNDHWLLWLGYTMGEWLKAEPQHSWTEHEIANLLVENHESVKGLIASPA